MRMLVLAVAVLCSIAAQAAEPYPTRTITIIVPFPPGAGGADALMRILAERMKTSLGQPLVVENVGGAGGSIGVARAVRAAPDGYTLSAGQWASHVGASAVYPVKYDVLSDLAPIILLGSNPMWMVVRSDLPAKDLPELIAWLRAQPDKASAATVGAGSASHLCTLNFQSNTGTRFQLIPYKGSDAIQDVMGGHVDLMCDQASNSLPFARAGKVRALAVMAKARWTAAPEVPTAAEYGLPDLELTFWYGLWAPKGTPREIIARLNAAAREAFADPSVRQRVANLGQEIPPPERQTPEALAAHHRAETERWWPMIKAANIKLD
jgi:tripartite-type tricarboxylate transporter receptor subunit TctC